MGLSPTAPPPPPRPPPPTPLGEELEEDPFCHVRENTFPPTLCLSLEENRKTVPLFFFGKWTI